MPEIKCAKVLYNTVEFLRDALEMEENKDLRELMIHTKRSVYFNAPTASWDIDHPLERHNKKMVLTHKQDERWTILQHNAHEKFGVLFDSGALYGVLFTVLRRQLMASKQKEKP